MCLRSSINTLFNNPVPLKLTRTICALTQPPFLLKNGIHTPEMTRVHPELAAKKLPRKLILKSSLLQKLAIDSKIPFMQFTEYTMKSERLIETLWFKSSTYTTSTSRLSGQPTMIC